MGKKTRLIETKEGKVSTQRERATEHIGDEVC